jgi:hypothetical protein
MNRIAFLFMIVLTISSRAGINGIGPNKSEFIHSNIAEKDTLKERQILYNGIVWENKYHRIKED